MLGFLALLSEYDIIYGVMSDRKDECHTNARNKGERVWDDRYGSYVSKLKDIVNEPLKLPRLCRII